MSANILQSVQYRLAGYYLTRLRAAEKAYRHGNESVAHGLDIFDQEWPQIKQWQSWAAERANQDSAAAHLCSAFCQTAIKLLSLRLEPQERLKWLESALEASKSLDDPAAQASHWLSLGALYHEAMGDYERATTCTEQALHLARQLKDQLTIANSLFRLGSITYYQGQLSEALRFAEQSRTLYHQLNDRQGLANCLNLLGAVALVQGRFSDARSDLGESLALYRALGDRHGAAGALTNVGNVLLSIGDLTGAEGVFEESLSICRELADQRAIAGNLTNLGVLARLREDNASATGYFERSFQIYQELGARREVAVCQINLGIIARERADHQAARECFEQSSAIRRELGDNLTLIGTLAELALESYTLDGFAATQAPLCEALALAQEMQSDAVTLELLAVVIQIWLRTGRIKEAARYAALLVSHPSAEHAIREDAMFLRPHLEALLGIELCATLWDEGHEMHLDSVITEIRVHLDCAG